MRKLDLSFLMALSLLLVYWSIILLVPEMTSPLVSFYYWMLDVATIMGYPGVVIISFLGNAAILFPLPYMGVAFILGGVRNLGGTVFVFDPWLIGILGGLGATIGEVTGYALGYAGNRFIDEDQTNGFLQIVEKYPRATPLVLWFLAATPIPDDVLIIPLGIARYPFWKVFIPQLVGKTMFLSGVAWAGRLSLEWIEDLIIGNPTSPISKSIEVLVLLLVVVMIYLIVRINWRKSNT